MKMNYAEMYGRIHEDSAKTYPGMTIRPYVPRIAKLVREVGAKRILDYGSGKGYQYLKARVHEEWGGVLPHCYDVGVRQLASRPEGLFDGLISTDMLEHIEKPDVPGVLDELIGFVAPGGFLFLGISCRPTRKKLPEGGDVHRTIESPRWWADLITDRYQRSGQRGQIAMRAEFDLGAPPHFPDASGEPYEWRLTP